MQKKHMIALATFVGLSVVWYLILSNSHMLAIFPCNEGTCGLIDVTRHARLNDAKLTGLGYALATLVVLGLPALVSFFVMKKIKK